jgi:hypothetical protein
MLMVDGNVEYGYEILKVMTFKDGHMYGLALGCLTPLSTIFQLYRGGQILLPICNIIIPLDELIYIFFSINLMFS